MKISVVTTLYYSEQYLWEFYRRIKESILPITNSYEIIFVNDGSPDQSLPTALAIQEVDNKVTIIDLTRNFGHHKAIMTGLRFSTGDFVFLIDCDLEESPELLTPFWNEMTQSSDVDVVYGIQKTRKGNLSERLLGSIFYRIFLLLSDIDYPQNTLTARLMSRRYIQKVTHFQEKELDLWGLFVLAGFHQKGIPVDKGHKGTTTYTFRKKLRMAIDTLTSFSSKPLHLIFLTGVCMLLFSLLNICFIFYQKFFYGINVEGWASVLASIWFVGGLIVFILGVISIYLSKMFIEIKARPLTIIKDVYQFK